jgi:hypothetical protein
MRTMLCIPAVLSILMIGMAMISARATAADSAPSGKVYELRIYTTNPGKLDALNARFRNHTCKLFQKHGIELVGFWTPTQGEEAKNTLIYIIAFPNAEAQKKSWQAFMNDPEWKKAKAESEKDGVLVKKVESKFMQATDYSPIK